MKMMQYLSSSIDLDQQERSKSPERPTDIWKLLDDGSGISNKWESTVTYMTVIRTRCFLYGRKNQTF